MATGSSRWSAVRRYYWRQLVLLAFGLVHVWVLLWPGDVLHVYAAWALIAFPLRRLKPRWLVLLGLSFATYYAIISGTAMSNAIHGNAVVAVARQHQAQGGALTAEEKKEIKNLEDWHRQHASARTSTAKELTTRGREFRGWASAMTGEWVSRYTRWRTIFAMYWESISTILIGAALFKQEIIQGARSRDFYLGMTIAGYAVGLPIRMIATWFSARMDDTVTYAWSLEEYSRLAMTIGHLGLICWVLAGAATARWLKPFAAAGRAALSLYILQTLLCVWLLYPPFAIGLFGKQGWMALMLTALAIDAVLLLLANWWVTRFEIDRGGKAAAIRAGQRAASEREVAR